MKNLEIFLFKTEVVLKDQVDHNWCAFVPQECGRCRIKPRDVVIKCLLIILLLETITFKI
jgi:hypothetical protein